MNLHTKSAKVGRFFARALSFCLGSSCAPFQEQPSAAEVSAKKRRSKGSAAGATLVETAFAAAIVTVTATGLYALHSHSLKIVGAGDQAAIAHAHTLARLEQIRNTGWAKVVDPAEITKLLTTPPPSALATPAGFKQVVSVYPLLVPATSPSPAPTATPTSATPYFTVTVSGTGTPVASPANFDPSTIRSQSQLNYRVLTEWTCWGKTHQRELSTAVARGGAR